MRKDHLRSTVDATKSVPQTGASCQLRFSTKTGNFKSGLCGTISTDEVSMGIRS